MKECYGTMFPAIPELRESNHMASGKVFQAQIHTEGPFQHQPKLSVNLAEWADCQECPYYRSCYDLSTAMLNMEQVLYQLA